MNFILTSIVLGSTLLSMTLAQSWRRQWNVPSNQPPTVSRLRMAVQGTKIVLSVSYSEPQVLDIFNFRIRWYEADNWSNQGEGRHYNLICWLEQHGRVIKTLMDRRVPAWVTGYSEKLRFPANFPAVMQCKVQAVNSAGLAGPWSFSERVKISDIPIYFQGVPGLDLRGFSNKEILNLLQRANENYNDY